MPIGLPGRWSWRWSWRSSARSAALVGGPALLIGVLAWPLLFTNSIFNEDWINQLWFLWHQSLTIRANHQPSLFLNYSNAVFYPEYLFYGATLYTLFGALSLALGDAPLEAYILGYLMAFAVAYGGWYWLGRIAGLGRWQACAPGLVYITSAYFTTLIYARGDWPEVLAISAIPLMIAAGLSVLQADRLRAWPALALVGSAIVFSGSHNITLLWGSTILALTALAILLCAPRARREITRSGAIRVAGLVVPALLVNAWFLLPAVVYQSRTVIASHYQHTLDLFRAAMPLVSTSHLLTPSRAFATSAAGFDLTLPILAIAWVLVGVALLPPAARRTTWMRVLLVIAALTAAIGVVMTHAGLLLALPRLYVQVQFSYRLETYLLLGVSGAVLAVLVLTRSGARRMRIWSWTLAPILIVSAIGAIRQTSSYPQGDERRTAFDAYLQRPLAKPGWTDYLDIQSDSVPYPAESAARIEFPATAVHGDRVSEIVHLSPGETVDTNIAGAYPGMVRITGARIAGIDAAGNAVLEVGPDTGGAGRASTGRGASTGRSASTERGASTPTETITVSAGTSPPIVLGRLLTLVAAAALAAQFAALALRRLRARSA